MTPAAAHIQALHNHLAAENAAISHHIIPCRQKGCPLSSMPQVRCELLMHSSEVLMCAFRSTTWGSSHIADSNHLPEDTPERGLTIVAPSKQPTMKYLLQMHSMAVGLVCVGCEFQCHRPTWRWGRSFRAPSPSPPILQVPTSDSSRRLMRQVRGWRAWLVSACTQSAPYMSSAKRF